MPPSTPDFSDDAILPEDVPVTMPELPIRLRVSTAQQFKAMGDATRLNILALIQSYPATAKQIAAKLKVSPGTIGHHLQVLEEAGLVQIVARRLIHGIVAKYYTRTARVFVYDFPYELEGAISSGLTIMTEARDQLIASIEAYTEDTSCRVSFPRARLSRERAQLYQERLEALIDDFLQETPDPDGLVYSLCTAYFKAAPHLQLSDTEEASVEIEES
ncbi:MAG TPA: winged helix-turn-helix domain-containing protein [Ktedonosporobacter sp.]|nr:winged helix-turn-helix domain-containing protein [Ktedonosporobacter sp.]